MDYSQLTLEERLERAQEYALLLEQDEQIAQNIPETLASTFNLTTAQAEKAYADMKVNYKSHYRQAKGNQITRGVVAFLVCIVCIPFYWFMGKELGWLFVLLGIVFAFVGLGALVTILGATTERYFPNAVKRYNHFIIIDDKGKKDIHWTLKMLLISFFFFSVLGGMYVTKSGYVKLNELRIVVIWC